MMSDAYQKYRAANGFSVSASTTAADLTPYINYVSKVTSGNVDLRPNYGAVDCANTSWWQCYRLHNGGTLILDNFSNHGFGGTSTSNAINFGFDPDSTYCGATSTNTPGQGVEFWMYYNGKLRTSATMETSTCRGDGCWYIGPGNDPSWFSWP